MTKNIGLFWLKDDFRITKNLALIEATNKHDQVVAFYLLKEKQFENQEAQKWWVSESLKEFEKKLDSFNIKLEIIKTETFKFFFEKLLTKKTIQYIGTEPMNPTTLNSMNT